jgi:hypothetical protein
MRFDQFKAKVRTFPLFRSTLFCHLTKDVPTLRRQMTEWCDKGSLIQLKRGMYTLPDNDRAVKFSRFFLANQLYTPSYISLESALSYYNMIPEAVHTVTSVSPKKTQQFTNQYGLFQYHHIKPDLYGDYLVVKDEFANTYFIASKERALIDFLYLRPRGLKSYDESIFTENFRLQYCEDIDQEKLLQITSIFSQKKLLDLVMLFIKWMD